MDKRPRVKDGAYKMPEQFISEPLTPVVETADTARMSFGEPGLPGQFKWRGRVVFVKAARGGGCSTSKPLTRSLPDKYN